MTRAIVPAGIERRASLIKVRVGAGRKLAGYAATFGRQAQIDSVREVIQRGAFGRSLTSGADILLLADHDPKKVLARTAAGNLSLAEDDRGLHFEATLPDTSTARDVLALVEARTAGGMSFGFVVPVEGDTWAGDLRTLRDVTLLEISVVSAWPAYAGTEVSARSRAVAAALARKRILESL
jgi:HK97 family phage prohead protease